MSTLREDWEFEHTASKLAEGARAQKEYRASRVIAWEQKKDEVMTEIKEKGLSIQAPEAEKFSSYSSHGDRTIIRVDASMQSRLDQCTSKITTHRELVKQYDAWIQVLEGNPEARLKLTHEDWMFFFGK